MLTSKASLALWHHRLGHVTEETILKMEKHESVSSITITNKKNGRCIPCLKGKQTRDPIPKSTSNHTTVPLGQVFSDLCGPITPKTHEGHRYFITFTDDYSWF